MYYSGIPTFLRCEYDDPENADVGIVGVPYSGGNWIERTQYNILHLEQKETFPWVFTEVIVDSKSTNYDYNV